MVSHYFKVWCEFLGKVSPALNIVYSLSLNCSWSQRARNRRFFTLITLLFRVSDLDRYNLAPPAVYPVTYWRCKMKSLQMEPGAVWSGGHYDGDVLDYFSRDLKLNQKLSLASVCPHQFFHYSRSYWLDRVHSLYCTAVVEKWWRRTWTAWIFYVFLLDWR